MAQEQKIMLPPDVNTQQLMMILNHIYPVGSYYETSDVNFDPNDSFVGEWSLEESGRVHVSAGTGYTIGDKGGNKDAIIPYHHHTASGGKVTDKAAFNTNNSGAISDGITGGAHTHDIKFRSVYSSGSNYTALYGGGNGTTNGAALSKEHTHDLPNHTHSIPSHGHGFTQPTISYVGESVTDKNMQPYIVVNRWHRDR